MSDAETRVIAGDCTLRFDAGGTPATEERGIVVVVVKPDDTVLVHDRSGYRPAAWLTRADTVSIGSAGGRTVLEARDGERRLRIECHDATELGAVATTHTGPPVARCPDCSGWQIRTPSAVTCLGCAERFSIPRDAELTDVRCEACAHPVIRVDRGARFSVCIDRRCQSLDDHVRDRFDGVWSCPTCGAPLRIHRRGGLIVGCDAAPECETAFALPSGVQIGTCETCELPRFETRAGQRCLDASCRASA